MRVPQDSERLSSQKLLGDSDVELLKDHSKKAVATSIGIHHQGAAQHRLRRTLRQGLDELALPTQDRQRLCHSETGTFGFDRLNPNAGNVR